MPLNADRHNDSSAISTKQVLQQTSAVRVMCKQIGTVVCLLLSLNLTPIYSSSKPHYR